ncbi:DUF7793 family protein [Nakamurella endophytica]|uniref:DUF7793 domain-containing protein n=1 Tax=Nakamurella endophytica TaxID=1748367 RepID=A0A917T9H2_9ACTN|nr:STAS/SEC14 domain-containing protein [Nakamurella endophytica]GGM15342.1 hypothetical protein GCM10011594_39210 [Nakamurella endophytica]
MSAAESSPEPEFTVRIDADGSVRLRWRRGLTITGEAAEAAMAEVNRVCGETRRPMLVDMATTEAVERRARTVFLRPCQANRIALLGRSPVDRVIANFIVGVSNMPCPTRYFTSQPDALRWLGVVAGDQPD